MDDGELLCYPRPAETDRPELLGSAFVLTQQPQRIGAGNPFPELCKMRMAASVAIGQALGGKPLVQCLPPVRDYAHRWHQLWSRQLHHERTAVKQRFPFDFVWYSTLPAPPHIVFGCSCVRFETLMITATLARMLYNAALGADVMCDGSVRALRAVIANYALALRLVRDVCLAELDSGYELVLERGAASGLTASPVYRIGTPVEAVYYAPCYPADVISRRALVAIESLCRAKMQFAFMRVVIAERSQLDAADFAALLWYAHEQYRRASIATQCEAHVMQMRRCIISILYLTARDLLMRARSDTPLPDGSSDVASIIEAEQQQQTSQSDLALAAVVLLTSARDCLQHIIAYTQEQQPTCELADHARTRLVELEQTLAEAQRIYRIGRGVLDERLMPAHAIYAPGSSAGEALRTATMTRYAPMQEGYFYLDEEQHPLPHYYEGVGV